MKNYYDAYHIGVSGGKDSTATLLWYIYESGLPLDKLHVSFCDTGNEDNITYDYIEMLSWHVYPIEKIRGDDNFYHLAQRKGRFPARKAQFCTQFLKIIPSREHVLNLMLEYGDCLLVWLGKIVVVGNDREYQR